MLNAGATDLVTALMKTDCGLTRDLYFYSDYPAIRKNVNTALFDVCRRYAHSGLLIVDARTYLALKLFPFCKMLCSHFRFVLYGDDSCLWKERTNHVQ